MRPQAETCEQYEQHQWLKDFPSTSFRKTCASRWKRQYTTRGNCSIDICERGGLHSLSLSLFCFFSLALCGSAFITQTFVASIFSFFLFSSAEPEWCVPMQIECRNQAPEVDAVRMSDLSHARGSNRIYSLSLSLAISRCPKTRLLPLDAFCRQLNPRGCPPPYVAPHFYPATVWHHPRQLIEIPRRAVDV